MRAYVRRSAVLAAASLLGAGSFITAGSAVADLAPSEGTVEVKPGGSATEAKTVTIPEFPAKADIEIAIDTTGSMGAQIAQAKDQATDLVNAVQAEIPDAHFAVVQFKDTFDVPEYAVEQAMTSDAAEVQAAINRLSAGGGGDFPEAYDRVFHEAGDPVIGGEIGWRDGSRKFVVVIGDAPPHIAPGSPSAAAYPSCGTSGFDDGFQTTDEMSQLVDAERTLFMVHVRSTVASCYEEIAATGFAGSQAVALGSDLATQMIDLIQDATSTVDEVRLAVSSAGPAPADAAWISFDPAVATGPFVAGDTIDFTVHVQPPADVPAGDYVFSIVALADGGSIGEQRLTVRVTAPTCATSLLDDSGAPALSEPGSLLNAERDEAGPISGPLHHDLESSLPDGVDDVVHEVNCTAVITVEDVLGQG